jgi:hypothetical protein
MASKRTRKTPTIKGIKDNSQVKEIGSMVRDLRTPNWYIEVKLDPAQEKEKFGVSQLGLIPRRRVLNVTKAGSSKVAGYEKDLKINATSTWSPCRIAECPIVNIRRQGDRQQWCFSFKAGDTQFFLPQIELARAFFFHSAYLTRLAMNPNGLDEEFDVQVGENPNRAEIHILPSSSLPMVVRGNPSQRRVLAWLLLDKEVRNSFQSIAQYQLTEGEVSNGRRYWPFRFDPPPLENVKIKVRGQYVKESELFFVYEIHSLTNLSSQIPKEIEFFDPKFTEQKAGKKGSSTESGGTDGPPEIDDDEPPTTDADEYVLEVQEVELEFSEPAYTTRKPSNGRRRSGARKGKSEEGVDDPANGQTDVSTDEPTVRGEVPAGVADGIDDQSEDSHLFTHKFEAFIAMSDLLEIKGCQIVSEKMIPLPAVKGHSKYRLPDGNLRYLLYRVLRYKNQNYALVEVDTVDSGARLSTLLLKQPSEKYDWHSKLSTLGWSLVKASLRWPTNKKLKKVFPAGFRRIPHQQNIQSSLGRKDTATLSHWVGRVYAVLSELHTTQLP